MAWGSQPIGFASLCSVLSALAALFFALACANTYAPTPPVAWEETRNLSGIEVRVVVRHPDEAQARTAIQHAFRAADAVADKLSVNRPGSEIDLLTKVPSHLWVEVSPETHAALGLGAEIAEETDGAYDYTWPVLLRLWGLREGGTPHVPRDFEIDMALKHVDWEDIEIRNEGGLQARRLHRRTELDLGGLARGAMLDAAVAQLRELGVVAVRASTADEHAFFGGSDPHPWRIELPGAKALLEEGAIASVRSGDEVETAEGQTLRRRFDPRSGRPASGSRWVAVRAGSAAASAGYADAVFAMGAEGRTFVESREDLEVVIAAEPDEPGEPSDTAEIWVSHNLSGQIEISNAP